METWNDVEREIEDYMTRLISRDKAWTQQDENVLIDYYTGQSWSYKCYTKWLASKPELSGLPVNVADIQNISLRDFLDLLFAKVIRIKCGIIAYRIFRRLELLEEVGGEDMDLVDPPDGYTHIKEEDE